LCLGHSGFVGKAHQPLILILKQVKMPPKPAPSMTMTPPTGIFDGLSFFLAPCLSLTEQANLRNSLADNGALEVSVVLYYAPKCTFWMK
jgi:hypothetical protein